MNKLKSPAREYGVPRVIDMDVSVFWAKANPDLALDAARNFFAAWVTTHRVEISQPHGPRFFKITATRREDVVEATLSDRNRRDALRRAGFEPELD